MQISAESSIPANHKQPSLDEQRFRRLAEGLPDIITSFDRNLRLIYTNPAGATFLGKQFTEFLGRSCDELGLPKELADDWEHHLKEVFRTGSCAKMDFNYVGNAGERYYHSVLFPEQDHHGTIVSIFVVTRDLTDKLLDERRASLAMNAAEEGVWDWNIQTGEVIWNKKLYELMEIEPDGETTTVDQWQSLIHPEDLPVVLAAMERYLNREDQRFNVEYRVITPKHTVKWILGKGEIVSYGTDRRPLRMVGSDVDITARKSVEEKIRKSAIEAERANRAKSEYLATVSHEIRTPMNCITGYADLLAETKLSDEQQECVGNIRMGAQALLAIISDILNFSKIESGQVDLHLRYLPIKELLEQTFSFFRQEAKLKNLSLNLSIEEEVPELLECDSERFRQVLTNLLGNAIKFTAEGGVNMHVSAIALHTKEKRDKLYQVNFMVQDTGIGIPSAILNKIFDPFYQGGTDIEERFGGSGLGLAIARRLCELMGGQITAASEEGKGSTFTATILSRGARTEEFHQSGDNPFAAGKVSGRKLKVLLIEDNRVNQRVVKLLLEKLGHDAEIAQNGAEALKAMCAGSFHVIFMDLNLPDIDGLDLAKKIRTQMRDGGREEPVMIALTARALMDDRDRCLQVGMHDYLSKPITLLRLKTVLEKHLG